MTDNGHSLQIALTKFPLSILFSTKTITCCLRINEHGITQIINNTQKYINKKKKKQSYLHRYLLKTLKFPTPSRASLSIMHNTYQTHYRNHLNFSIHSRTFSSQNGTATCTDLQSPSQPYLIHVPLALFLSPIPIQKNKTRAPKDVRSPGDLARARIGRENRGALTFTSPLLPRSPRTIITARGRVPAGTRKTLTCSPRCCTLARAQKK